MRYLFQDESYRTAGNHKQVVMAAWAVEQRKWRLNPAARFNIFNPPVLRRIGEMLEAVDGTAIVATATLDDSLFRSGEIDRTNDISSMARPDTIWSIAATFAAGALMRRLLEERKEVGTVDVHFDLKNLKPDHAEAWKKANRDLLVGVASEASKAVFGRSDRLVIRRIQSVANARR